MPTPGLRADECFAAICRGGPERSLLHQSKGNSE